MGAWGHAGTIELGLARPVKLWILGLHVVIGGQRIDQSL